MSHRGSIAISYPFFGFFILNCPFSSRMLCYFFVLLQYFSCELTIERFLLIKEMHTFMDLLLLVHRLDM